jgi:rubrerythrin
VTIVVTSETGGTAAPVGALYVPPDRQVIDAGSTVLADAGLDAVFVGDLLSAFLAHERCGTHLYRSVAGRTADPAMRAQYEQFGEETREHVDKLERLIEAVGGDPQYVSGPARATEKAAAGLLESTFLLEGSLDPVTAELAMLEAVMLAEAKDRANWAALAKLAAQIGGGEVQRRFQTVAASVLAQEDDHYTWASDTRTKLLLTMAVGGSAADGGRRVEPTKDELYARAQEMDIPGRSQMNKEQLQAAVEDQEGASS